MSVGPCRGFVLARREHREVDLRVTLLLDDGRLVHLVAPAGLRSRQRFAAGLSPLVLYRFVLAPQRRGGLRLQEAVVDRAWPSLLADVRRSGAALAATGVALDLGEPAPVDAHAFLLLGELYTRLATEPDPRLAAPLLVRFVFESLAQSGHGLALDRCVRCGTPAPDEATVTLDPTAGGVVCRGCGGGPFRLRAPDRAALRALVAGELTRYDVAMLDTCARLAEGVAPGAAAILRRAAPLLRDAGPPA